MADTTVQRTMMVDTQIRPSDVTKFPVIAAMLSVPREEFVPDASRETAYRDGPIDLGHGRVMLEPRALAKMLDALDLRPDEMVLDLGCGLGYSTAVIAQMVEAVVAVEEDEALAGEAETQLAAANADNAVVVTAPLADGAAKHGPYDAVILQGGIERLPQAIIDQIKDGGRIVAIFIDGVLGTCRIGHRSGDSVQWRDTFNASAPVLPGYARVPEFQL